MAANLCYLFRQTGVLCEIGCEFFDGGGILVIGDEQHLRAIEIDKQGDIIMAAACGGFVEGEPGDAGVIGAGAGLLDVVLENPPQSGVVLT